MSLPQIPPRRGDNPRHVYFTYVGCDRGYQFEAWTAGPCMWFAMHPSTKSKPCLEEMTGGKLKCSLCSAGKLAAVKGYVPLYRAADAKPVMVVVDEASRDEIDKFELHTRVKVGREKSRGSCVWVKKLIVQEPKWQTTLPERRVACDLTFTLLRMWAIPELQAWYNTNHYGASDITLSLEHGVAVNDKGEVIDPMHQAAAKRAGFNVSTDPKHVAKHRDQVRELMEHASKDGTLKNGKGKHKPPTAES